MINHFCKNNNVRMKLQTLQVVQVFIECKIMVGCRLCAYPSIHVETLKITVGCPPCTYPSIHLSPDEDTLKFTVGCRFCTGFCVVWCGMCVCSLLFSPLFRRSLFCSLSVTMTMITRPVGSLCVLTARRSACAGRTCSHHARNNCPGITVQASCHLEWSGPVFVLEMGDVFVFGCVWFCEHVSVCDSM